MNKKGVILAEIIIIIFIIIIVSTIAYPNFKKYTQNLEIKGSTRQLVSHLKIAQQYTVTEQVKYIIRIQPLNKTYYLVKNTTPETIVETYTLDDSVYFKSNTGIQNNEVSFNFGGGVEYAGQIFISHLYTDITTIVDIKPSGYVNWQEQ